MPRSSGVPASSDAAPRPPGGIPEGQRIFELVNSKFKALDDLVYVLKKRILSLETNEELADAVKQFGNVGELLDDNKRLRAENQKLRAREQRFLADPLLRRRQLNTMSREQLQTLIICLQNELSASRSVMDRHTVKQVAQVRHLPARRQLHCHISHTRKAPQRNHRRIACPHSCPQIMRQETAGKMPSDLLDDIDIDTVIGPAPSDVLLALPGLAAQPLAGGPVVDAEQILTCNVNTLTVTCENLRQQLARRSDIETLLNTVNAGVAALAGADAEGSTGLIWKEKKLGRMTILNQELCSRVAQLDAEMHTKDATIEQLMAVQSRTAAEKATLISERAAAVDAASVKATALGAVERQLTTANERLRVAVKMSSVLALGLLAAGEGSQCDETHALEFVGRMFVDSLKAMTELNKYSTRIQRVARGHQVRRVASSLLASAGVRIPSKARAARDNCSLSSPIRCNFNVRSRSAWRTPPLPHNRAPAAFGVVSCSS